MDKEHMLLHEVKALKAPGRMYYFVVVFVWIGIYHAETLDRARRFSPAAITQSDQRYGWHSEQY